MPPNTQKAPAWVKPTSWKGQSLMMIFTISLILMIFFISETKYLNSHHIREELGDEEGEGPVERGWDRGGDRFHLNSYPVVFPFVFRFQLSSIYTFVICKQFVYLGSWVERYLYLYSYFTSGANNSLIMSQGMGPKPREKANTKTDSDISGTWTLKYKCCTIES